jgi:hypothetical protein
MAATAPTAPDIVPRPLCAPGQAKFFWRPPTSNGGEPVTKYTLACEAISYSQDLSANVANYVVTGLTDKVELTFTITATNSVGTGPAATFRSIQTGTTPFGPTQATLTKVNQTTFQLDWDQSTLAVEALPKWFRIRGYPSTPLLSSFSLTAYNYDRRAVIPNLSTNTYYQFLVQAINDVGYCRPFAFTPTTLLTQDYPLTVGTSSSLLIYARALNGNRAVGGPTSLGALTINSQGIGGHEVTVANATTISSFTASSWFSSTADSLSSWVVVKGNLTINSGITFTPSVRKLFTVLYVAGNLVNNGTISMTARGASHSGTTARNIRIATGSFSAVTDPQVPAAGGAGGPSGYAGGIEITNISGVAGSAGTGGGTGGGGSGAAPINSSVGLGSAGTSFSGGCGGGAGGRSTAANAAANGGAGGNADRADIGNSFDFEGGGGNPGGTNPMFTAPRNQGRSGTGGVLIVIVEGSISGTGTIEARGVLNENPLPWETNPTTGSSGFLMGGSTGGGSVTVMYGGTNSITPLAGGGNIADSPNPWKRWGGSGGAGTARALKLA